MKTINFCINRIKIKITVEDFKAIYSQLTKTKSSFFNYIINLELSEERQMQYACPSCLRSVAIFDFRSGSINCLAISSFYNVQYDKYIIYKSIK